MENYYNNINQGFNYSYNDSIGIANASMFDNNDLIEKYGLDINDDIYEVDLNGINLNKDLKTFGVKLNQVEKIME